MAEENKAETTQEVKDTETSSGEQSYDEKTLQAKVEEATKETANKIKRDYSKRLGVNLFEDDEVDSFVKGLESKVDKSAVEEYEKQLEEYKSYKTKYEDTQFDLAITKAGVSDDAVPKVKKLANVEMQEDSELTYEKAIDKVMEEYGAVFKKGKKAGLDLNQDNSTKTGYEEHIESNPRYKNNPYIKK